MSDVEPPAKRARLSTPGPIAVIATPMAGKKLHKKVYKVVKKAAGAKALKRGVKEVVKAVRKGETGLCVLAGDISPIDVISHIPVMCEDRDIPYVYVESKAELGAAAATKRPTSVVLVATKGPKGSKTPKFPEDEKERLDEVLGEIKELTAE